MPIIFVSEIDHFGAQSGRGSIFIRRLELLRVLAMSYKALLGSVAVAVAVADTFRIGIRVGVWGDPESAAKYHDYQVRDYAICMVKARSDYTVCRSDWCKKAGRPEVAVVHLTYFEKGLRHLQHAASESDASATPQCHSDVFFKCLTTKRMRCAKIGSGSLSHWPLSR